MTGLKPVVVGLIGAAVITTGKTVFFPDGIETGAWCGREQITAGIIFLLMLILVKKKVHPIAIICLSAGLGIVAGCVG